MDGIRPNLDRTYSPQARGGIIDWISRLLDTQNFVPHGQCYLWQKDILAMHVGSDLVTGLSYYSIPLALIYFTVKRKGARFGWAFYMFSVFIFMCGTAHFFAVWTTWNPMYGTEGLIKVGTAAVSVATAVAVWPLVPRALAIPSFEQLESANRQLQAEADAKNRLEETLRELRSREILAEDRERRRLGTGLHDGIGQILTLVNMRLGAIRDEAGDSFEDPIRDVQDLVREAQKQIRTLAFELSPPVLRDMGFRAAVDWLAEDVEGRFGLAVEVRTENLPLAMDEAARVTLFRALRELLSNVAKHADVDAAEVALRGDAEWVHGRVSDRGAGFTIAEGTRGFGLISIQEEFRHLGGEIDVVSRVGEGTEVSFSLPIE